jgi:hypothetical protein
MSDALARRRRSPSAAVLSRSRTKRTTPPQQQPSEQHHRNNNDIRNYKKQANNTTATTTTFTTTRSKRATPVHARSLQTLLARLTAMALSIMRPRRMPSRRLSAWMACKLETGLRRCVLPRSWLVMQIRCYGEQCSHHRPCLLQRFAPSSQPGCKYHLRDEHASSHQ